MSMEAVIFIGVQASGKTTFFRERFFDSHVRLNLDMLRTRHRESILLAACLEAKQSFVVDNTNPAVEDRRRYIDPAKEHHFRVIGYYFQSSVEACKERNAARVESQVVPLPGLLGTHRRLEVPSYAEGFDELNYVRIAPDGGFEILEWSDEV